MQHTPPEATPEYDSDSPISTLQVLQTEQRRATSHSSGNVEYWRLKSDMTQRTQDLINYLYNCSGHQLTKIPRLTIDGSHSIDVGGVFRNEINQVFRSLFESEIFTLDTNGFQTFTEYNVMNFTLRTKQYFVLGRIFYWFVFIHRHIAYPVAINPAIISFAIYGEIPLSVMERINGGLARALALIKTYNFRTAAAAIDEDVLQWLSQIGIDFSDFIEDLHHQQRGPHYLIRMIGNTVILGNCKPAFEEFQKGFTSQRGFSSVYLFKSVKLINSLFMSWILSLCKPILPQLTHLQQRS